jgi:hypothetical protein
MAFNTARCIRRINGFNDCGWQGCAAGTAFCLISHGLGGVRIDKKNAQGLSLYWSNDPEIIFG